MGSRNLNFTQRRAHFFFSNATSTHAHEHLLLTKEAKGRNLNLVLRLHYAGDMPTKTTLKVTSDCDELDPTHIQRVTRNCTLLPQLDYCSVC